MIHIDTTQYVRSHMHAPRGRGAWAFGFDHANDNRPVSTDSNVVWFAPAMLSFTEAKAAARREAIVRRARIVHVLP